MVDIRDSVQVVEFVGGPRDGLGLPRHEDERMPKLIAVDEMGGLHPVMYGRVRLYALMEDGNYQYIEVD